MIGESLVISLCREILIGSSKIDPPTGTWHLVVFLADDFETEMLPGLMICKDRAVIGSWRGMHNNSMNKLKRGINKRIVFLTELWRELHKSRKKSKSYILQGHVEEKLPLSKGHSNKSLKSNVLDNPFLQQEMCILKTQTGVHTQTQRTLKDSYHGNKTAGS